MEELPEKKQTKGIEKVMSIFLVLALALTVFNQFQILSITSGKQVGVPTGMSIVQAAVIPTGTPNIYGQELGIKYEDVNQNNPGLADKTIGIMANLDRTMDLQGDDLERYIDISSQISCEYCCGAGSIIVRREDVEEMNKKIEAAIESGQITEEQAGRYKISAGAAACGCAHSYAMRGLAKYLITEHGDEFTDEEILNELAKWKTLFFPGPMSAKAEVMKQQGVEFTYANLGSNRYRGMEQGATSGSGMVGGC